MVAHVRTVAFHGVEAVEVDVQVQVAPGLPAFTIVGLPDKAVAESRERVRAALGAIGLALPPKRITVNLAPADLPKEGSHFDVPIALGLLGAIGVISSEFLDRFVVVGELSLDGSINAVIGSLPAAICANALGRGLICPRQAGPEAVWAGEDVEVLAPGSLIQLINHYKGTQMLSRPEPELEAAGPDLPDLCDIKGQETAKRALEVTAAGGHNLLLNGPPGAGKSMLARRLPSILPVLDPSEMLEVSMISSIAGELRNGRISRRRPFRDPHHSASPAAIIGGGTRAKPGEVTLAHLGVLFLDELPEFSPQVLEALRQPMESGSAVVARANHHVTYPARFQLVAAMNPCRCGHAGEPGHTCRRGERCASDYQARLSGPLLDRIDLRITVPQVAVGDLSLPAPREGSAQVAARVAAARRAQAERFAQIGRPDLRVNAQADGALLEAIAKPDDPGCKLLNDAARAMKLSARGYHRVLRVARTVADLRQGGQVRRIDIAEALSYRGASMSQRLAA